MKQPSAKRTLGAAHGIAELDMLKRRARALSLELSLTVGTLVWMACNPGADPV
jgi:hypothetical protein